VFRIQILGSVHRITDPDLDLDPGLFSEAFTMPKKIKCFLSFLLLITFTLTSACTDRVIKKSRNSRNQGLLYFIFLSTEVFESRSGSIQIITNPDPGMPKNQCCRSGIRCLSDPWIRNRFFPDPVSRIPNPYF
jgi:hypothetical protein